MKSPMAHRGFTLIELMVVLAIVAILFAIAVPSYRDFMLRSRLRVAQTDLIALSVAAENFLQRQLRYPGDPAVDTAAVRALYRSWSPTQDGLFNYKYTPTGTPVNGYTLEAEWLDEDSRLAGCSIGLTSANVRTMSDECGNAGGGVAW
jgi:type IV pilus assembly protein PilE